MLRYMGLGQYAQRIEMACFDVIREGRVSVKFLFKAIAVNIIWKGLEQIFFFCEWRVSKHLTFLSGDRFQNFFYGIRHSTFPRYNLEWNSPKYIIYNN